MDNVWNRNASDSPILQIRRWLSNSSIGLPLAFGIGLFCIGITYEPIRINAVIGIISISLVIVVLTTRNYIQAKHIYFGERKILIPLLIITTSILISPSTVENKLFGLSMIAVYLVGNRVGKEPLRYLWIPVIIGTISILYIYFTDGGFRNGGIFEDYNIATGILVLGMVTGSLYIAPIVILGLLFTGSDEATFAITGLVIYWLISGRWKTVILITSIIVIVSAIIIPTGLQSQWLREKTVVRTKAFCSVVAGIATWDFDNIKHDSNIAFSTRPIAYRVALEDIEVLGHGYEPFNMASSSEGGVHNIPLRILHEVGILAAIAWLWIMIYNIKKFKGKDRTIWIAIGLLSVFDHFLWTLLGIWFWYLLGVSSNPRHKEVYGEQQSTNVFA